MGGMNLAAFTAPFQYARPVQQETPWDAAAKFGQLRALAQAQQLRQQEIQLQAVDAAIKQNALATTQSLNDAYKQAWTTNPDTGQTQLDKDKFISLVAQSGHGAALPEVQKAWNEYDKSHGELLELNTKVKNMQADRGGTIGQLLDAMGYEPNGAMTLLQHEVNAGTANPDNVNPIIGNIRQLMTQDPTGATAKAYIQQKADQLKANSPAYQTLLKTRGEITAQATTEATQQAALTEKQRALGREEMLSLPVDPNTKLPTQEAWDAWSTKYKNVYNAPPMPDQGFMKAVTRSGVAPKDIADYDLKMSRLDAMQRLTPADWNARVDRVIPPTGDTANLNARTKGLVQDYVSRSDWDKAETAIKDASDQLGRTETGVRTAKATAPIKIYEAGAEAGARTAATAAAQIKAGGMTQDDINREGQEYAITGKLQLGRAPALQQQIIHAGNEWARQNNLSPREVLLARAAYAGDTASLKNFQKQRDQVVSFEQTAQKNLDLFLSQAQKVIDTGSPWINKPLRELNEKLLGSADQAAVNVARNVANNEIAKVTSGGGLSGVLSDSARHEVAGYNPSSATFAQTVRIAQILKQDMANRHQSMDQTIENIKSRIGGQPAAEAPTTAPKATHRYNPQTKQIEAIP